MALSGGVSKGLAGVVALGFIGAGVIAYREAQRRGQESDSEHEARLVLPELARQLARCSVSTGSLPESSGRVPTKLAAVAGKPYMSTADDWHDAAFTCASFSLKTPQALQYDWRKDSTLSGRVEARADLDLNGAPDKWFEIRVTCTRPGQCEAENFATEVSAEGVRSPPGVLTWLGRSQRYLGEPPSLSADDVEPVAKLTSLPVSKPPAIVAGAPSGLDALYFEAERRAAAALAGAVLLELEFDALHGKLATPAQGTKMLGFYGVPDVKGKLKKGAAVVRVTFDAQGLVEKLDKAPRDLGRVGFAECLPEKMLAALGKDDPLAMTLGWDPKRERATWQIKLGRAEQRYSADYCAMLK